MQASETTSPPDPALAAAVDAARAALLEDLPADQVGEHLGATTLGEHAVAHAFRSLARGYTGWVWSVTLTRAPGRDEVTVCEVVQLPVDGALLAPAWVPWSERLRPGDLGPGDLLPTRADDPRLAPGYAALDDAVELADLHWELGLGRPRVLSREGRADASARWYDGDGGPGAPLARQAPATCSTCGFWVPLVGSLGRVFGACANDLAPDDRGVVSADHGCGAHSEALVMAAEEPTPVVPPAEPDETLEPLPLTPAGSVDATGTEPLGHS